MSRNRKADAVAAAKDWNDSHPVGTQVLVKKDDKSTHEATTRSPAWVLGDDAVVMVTGITGGYLLSRVKAVKE